MMIIIIIIIIITVHERPQRATRAPTLDRTGAAGAHTQVRVALAPFQPLL